MTGVPTGKGRFKMSIETAREPYSTSVGDASLRTKRPRRLLVLRLLTFVLPILVILGAVGGSIAMSSLSPEPEETENPIKALPVLVKRAETDSVTLSVKAQGEVEPRTQINLVTQVGGRITYMSPKFIEGGRFERGDILVRVDPVEYRLRVTQAQANVRQAETVIARENSEAQLARADWVELGRGGTPTPLTLREPQMAEAQAQLASAQAQLDEARLQLSRTELRAPFTGRVGTQEVDNGEFVAIGTRLGEIYATDIMDVRLPLTQNDLRQAGLFLGYEAPPGEGVPVTLSAIVGGTRAEWSGFIRRTESRFDSQSRVLHAYAEVTDAFVGYGADRPALAPGLYVEADIDGPTLNDVVTIPREGLRGTDQVYIATDDGTLSIRMVEVLSSTRDRVVLGSGLAVGESVIISPIRGAAEGMTIEVVETTAGISPETAAVLAPGEGA